MINVKYYSSAMTGAPQVSNTWGAIIPVLDACLVNGFNVVNVTEATFNAGVVTLTTATNHGFHPLSVISVSGATQPEYNGEFRISSIPNPNQLTYEITGNPSSPATGTITVKVAPLNWVKSFSDVDKAVYRSVSSVSSPYLRVDASLPSGYTNTWAKFARVGFLETMTGIDDLSSTVQMPYNAAKPTYNWESVDTNQFGWYKWYWGRNNGAVADNDGDGGVGNRSWVIIGDDQLFYLFIKHSTSTSYSYAFYAAGDIISYTVNDHYGVLLTADNNPLVTASVSYPGGACGYGLVEYRNFVGKLLFRDPSQIGSHISCGITSLNTNNAELVLGRGNVPYPNSSDYSIVLLPAFIQQSDNNIRGMFPGLYVCPQTLPYDDLTIIDNVIGLNDRKFLVVKSQYNSANTFAYPIFDITGPWR